MKIRTVLIVIATAGASLPTLGQTNKNNNQALADCVQAADQKYKDTWEAVCAGLAREAAAGLSLFQRPGCCKGYCTEFIGSPRDREFSQLRIEEMTLCSRLYGTAVTDDPASPHLIKEDEYPLHIFTNGNLHQQNDTFKTIEECEEEGTRLASQGKIRSYFCSYATD